MKNISISQIMKAKVIIGVAIMLMASCTSNKQTKLDSLKTKEAKLAEQIKTLQEEIAPADSSNSLKNASLVAFAQVKPSTFNHFIEVFGKLDGDDNVTVSARTAGTVEEVFVSAGQKVKKDQVLAKLDNTMIEKSLSDIEANYKYANDVYEKQKALWAQNVGSENDYLRAKSQKESLESRLASMKEQLDMYDIKSPINGTLEENNLKVGQALAPGIAVMRVVNFDRIKVVADLSESYATKVKEGDQVRIYFPDLKKEVPAVINFSSRYINPVNRTFSVEAHMKEDIPYLKANMLVVLKINDYKAENSITLPIDVIQKDQHGSYVFLAAAHGKTFVAKKVVVTTGQSYNGFVEILKGLNPDDKVITIGYQDLEDGEPIRF